MPKLKMKNDVRARNGAPTSRGSRRPKRGSGVLTLAETAAFLRVTEQDVLRLIHEQNLPGRSAGDDWRFLRSAVENWLGAPAAANPAAFLQTQFGALREDPHLADIVREAYRQRGRPGDGEP
jgi:excisionase family DNA binding protein